VPEISTACPRCEQEIEEGSRCEICAAAELFGEFLQTMPEIDFLIVSWKWPEEAQIVEECYHGDARAYFLQSWESFLLSKC
jgi:hypothetical protein